MAAVRKVNLTLKGRWEPWYQPVFWLAYAAYFFDLCSAERAAQFIIRTSFRVCAEVEPAGVGG